MKPTALEMMRKLSKDCVVMLKRKNGYVLNLETVETWLRIDALWEKAYRSEVHNWYFEPQYNEHFEIESYMMVMEV